MTTHSGCLWDYPEDVALAHKKVRGIKLALSSVLDDDDESAAILNEVGDLVTANTRHLVVKGGFIHHL
jgi:hypothetical protein